MRFVSHNYLEVLNYDISENRDLTDPEQIEKALKLGEYIKQGELLPNAGTGDSQCFCRTKYDFYRCREHHALFAIRQVRLTVDSFY